MTGLFASWAAAAARLGRSVGRAGGKGLRLAIPLVLLWQTSQAMANPDRLLDRLERERRPGYAFDFANAMSAQERQAIENVLLELEQRTGAQVKVVALASLEGGQIEDMANRLFERWGIGRKGRDNGVLLLAAMKERRVRIEVGYGLEGALPDARAGRILDQSVLPAFRRGQSGAGLVAGAQAIADVIAENAGLQLGARSRTGVEEPAPSSRASEGVHPILGLLFVIAFIYMAFRHPILLLLLLGGGRSRGGRSFGGGFGGGGFGGFGGGSSGGGGASRGW
jgi:uncharacterized protein